MGRPVTFSYWLFLFFVKIVLNKTWKIFTNKKDKFMHGIGLKNIKDTVYKYNGEIKIEFDDDKFVIKFIFSLKN